MKATEKKQFMVSMILYNLLKTMVSREQLAVLDAVEVANIAKA